MMHSRINYPKEDGQNKKGSKSASRAEKKDKKEAVVEKVKA